MAIIFIDWILATKFGDGAQGRIRTQNFQRSTEKFVIHFLRVVEYAPSNHGSIETWTRKLHTVQDSTPPTECFTRSNYTQGNHFDLRN